MNYQRQTLFSAKIPLCFVLVLILQIFAAAQGNVKRVVVIKVDGLPYYYVDQFVRQRDEKTGKSMLPWFDEVFYKNGTRAANFYVRGMSLSAPSWSVLDTGQHLQIKGNVEYDRMTLRPYDYLNIIPYYVGYGLKNRVDMPGVEVLDQLKIPLLSDAFNYENRYTSQQLYQRGNEWEVFGSGFIKLFPKDIKDLTDEWTIGFDFRNITISQNERDITGKLIKNPEINYYDFYNPSFDHISHLNNDTQSRFAVLKELDGTIGRIWTAIRQSSRADETALLLVSDHGFTSEENTYSQGFNIVKLLASAEGGGHHVITKRRLMLDYSIKGINPFVPLITTASKDSYYLKDQSNSYPTALVDFDGNERSSIHLRDNDLNILQILLQQLQDKKLAPSVRPAVVKTFFDTLDDRRTKWQKEIEELGEELDAIHRWIDSQQPTIKAQPKKFTAEDLAKGLDKEARRLQTLVEIASQDETAYRKYIRVLSNLLALKSENFSPEKLKIEDYIAEGAMGDNNSVYELQNYVVGLSDQGLIAGEDNKVDFEKSFKRVNYFDFIQSRTVLNNVQPKLGNRPIDFIAKRIPARSISAALAVDLNSDEDPIWLYGGADKQALILTRDDGSGNLSFKYLPIANLHQAENGKFSFEIKNWSEGFPLKIFEDANLNIAAADKVSWLGSWHTENEWLHATHKTLYSTAIIDLNEQMDSHPLTGHENEGQTPDDKLIHRFRLRERRLIEADMLLLANRHWNFDVRGFNPGGNHGSFFRASTNSTLMAAGGAKTGIRRGLVIEEPYDNLSFVPTVLRLMGKTDDNNQPNEELYKRGFRRFPGRVIKELINVSPETK